MRSASLTSPAQPATAAGTDCSDTAIFSKPNTRSGLPRRAVRTEKQGGLPALFRAPLNGNHRYDSLANIISREAPMRCRQFLLPAILYLATAGISCADGLLQKVLTNPVVQGAGSVVTYQVPNFQPAPVVINTMPAPNPVPQGPPLTASDPNAALFHPTIAAPSRAPVPVIYQGPPSAPPPGMTQGTVCQPNGICQLMPIPVTPSSTPRPSVAATPLYPPGGYPSSTFGSPTPTKPPNGVNLDVSPVAQSTDMSSTRAEVFRILSK